MLDNDIRSREHVEKFFDYVWMVGDMFEVAKRLGGSLSADVGAIG